MTWWGNSPAALYIPDKLKQTKTGVKNIDSSQIAAHIIFPKLTKRNGMNHLIFHPKFSMLMVNTPHLTYFYMYFFVFLSAPHGHLTPLSLLCERKGRTVLCLDPVLIMVLAVQNHGQFCLFRVDEM